MHRGEGVFKDAELCGLIAHFLFVKPPRLDGFIKLHNNGFVLAYNDEHKLVLTHSWLTAAYCFSSAVPVTVVGTASCGSCPIKARGHAQFVM